MSDAYDMIDRFLRNNLGDDDYADFSATLDSLCVATPQQADAVPDSGVTHDLKLLPEYFAEVQAGTKTFELRKDDRGFRVGDSLRLHEWSEAAGYTGREALRRVLGILRGPIYGLKEGFTILSTAPQQAEAAPDWNALRHRANEWADMATNGLQWLRNIVDGISDPKEALADMESNLKHCVEVNNASDVQNTVRVVTPPANCRQRLAKEGKPHPRSSCAVCGSLSPKWQECNLALASEGAKKK